MCCLKYEQDVYEELLRFTPKVGALVNTPEGRGIVSDSNLLTGELQIRLDSNPDVPKTFNRKDVSLLRDGQIRLDKKELAALKELEDK